jgi:surface protein
MNCVYRKIYGEDRFYLLHHYQEDFSYDDEEKHKLYLEAKKNINEENIEIYVNNKKIKFTREYKDDENTYSINVKFKFKKLLTSTGWMFYLCHSLQSIDLSSFKGDNITNMCYMFEASGIKKVDFFSVNTSRVTNMRHMFSNCTDLVEVNLCSLDTSNVTNMNNMFSYCIKLKEIDLFSFNTEKVQDMSFMFYECSFLREVNISSFNTKNVKDFSCMFEGCPYLKNKNLN